MEMGAAQTRLVEAEPPLGGGLGLHEVASAQGALVDECLAVSIRSFISLE